MPDLTAIAQAFSAFKAMKDIAEATIGLRDAAAFRERQIEFQGKIIDAQNALFTLQEERASLIERIGTIEKELADLKGWGAEKQKYELKPISGFGAFAHMLKPDARGTEPPHWLCTQCYENGKKSVIQVFGEIDGYKIWKCPGCVNQFRTWARDRPVWL